MAEQKGLNCSSLNFPSACLNPRLPATLEAGEIMAIGQFTIGGQNSMHGSFSGQKGSTSRLNKPDGYLDRLTGSLAREEESLFPSPRQRSDKSSSAFSAEAGPTSRRLCF